VVISTIPDALKSGSGKVTMTALCARQTSCPVKIRSEVDRHWRALHSPRRLSHSNQYELCTELGLSFGSVTEPVLPGCSRARMSRMDPTMAPYYYYLQQISMPLNVPCTEEAEYRGCMENGSSAQSPNLIFICRSSVIPYMPPTEKISKSITISTAARQFPTCQIIVKVSWVGANVFHSAISALGLRLLGPLMFCQNVRLRPPIHRRAGPRMRGWSLLNFLHELTIPMYRPFVSLFHSCRTMPFARVMMPPVLAAGYVDWNPAGLTFFAVGAAPRSILRCCRGRTHHSLF
jgi:hypothetical protein